MPGTLRAFIRHHYFAELIIAALSLILSHWETMPGGSRSFFIGVSILFLGISAFSRWDAEQVAKKSEMASNEVIRSLIASQAKRPMIQVAYEWQQGDPKDKPFVVFNAGDDEARRIHIHPIEIGGHTVTFGIVGQLLPGSQPVTREPKVGLEMGMFFRTLIDVINKALQDRSTELKAKLPTDGTAIEQFDRRVGAETEAHRELEQIPVAVSYENRKGATVTMEYQLRIHAFGSVKSIELEFASER